MSLLSLLGLDDLADGINEFTSGFEELKGEIIESVLGPGEELKNTIDEIAGSVTNGPVDTPTE